MKRSPVESERLIATIPRGDTGEIRVRWVRLHSGFTFVDVRFWQKKWSGWEPKKGIALAEVEAPPVGDALKGLSTP